MLNFLPSKLVGAIAGLLLVVNVLFWITILFIFTLPFLATFIFIISQWAFLSMNLEKLVKIIAENVDIEVETIDENTTFDSLGIDSLATVELVMQLEEELGCELQLDEKLLTVGDLLKFIEKKQSQEG